MILEKTLTKKEEIEKKEEEFREKFLTNQNIIKPKKKTGLKIIKKVSNEKKERLENEKKEEKLEGLIKSQELLSKIDFSQIKIKG